MTYYPKLIKSIITEFQQMMKQGKQIPHMLFYGSPGTGKTSCCKQLAKILLNNRLSVDQYLEVNASDNRGIDAMRQLVINFSRYPCYRGKKVILLDEADYLTADAQATLRQPMVNYKKNCLFLLTCNQIHKIHKAIVSRCKLYEFKPYSEEEMFSILQSIETKNNLMLSNEQKQKLVSAAKGDIRFIENNILSNLPEVFKDLSLSKIKSLPHYSLFELVLSCCQKSDGNTIIKYLFEEFSKQRELKKPGFERAILQFAKTQLSILKGGSPHIHISNLCNKLKNIYNEYN